MQSESSSRVVWVLGASGGLGAAIVRRLSDEGATVVESSRSVARDEPDPATRRWRLPVDVRDDACVRAAAKAIVERHGRIDGIVSSTNVDGFGDFLDLDDDAWMAVLDTKLMGAVRPLRAALPGMCERGCGAVVIVTGRGGISPPVNHFPGSSMNAALDLLVQGLGRRFGPQGIRVNSVAPGPVQSPRFARMATPGAPETPARPNALPGPCRPEDVADAVAFLLSDAARFINGSRLAVDGGGPPYA